MMRSFHKFLTALSVLALTLGTLGLAQAATLTSANDFVTRLEAGVASNHDFTFVTPTGAAEGDTFIITFESAFDTSSIVEDDVDVEDDTVDLTTAASCAGAEQAAVVIAADILTITICPGDGGAIAGGSTVDVKIGTNATASGTGVNQVVNPTGAGTYFLDLAGTFGDSGSILLPIGSNDQVAVTATISGAGGGGGGGGGGSPPPPGDISAPVISNVVVSGVIGSSATISWNTNEPANGNVDYGPNVSYGIVANEAGGYITIHSRTLTGLTGGTTYHFRVRAADISSNASATGDYTFTTLDAAPPVISAVSVVDITTTGARVIWSTDEPSDSKVDYGMTIGYGDTVTNVTPDTSHSVILTGLASGTIYHFRVRSTDASLNGAVSTNGTFTTLSNPPPTNVSGLIVTPGDGQNALSWSNPADADLADIVVNVCPGTFPSGPSDVACTSVFSGLATEFVHGGLANGQAYFYGVYARDTSGQFSSGALGTGTPNAPEEELPPEVPPPAVPPELPPAPETGGTTGGACGDGVCSDLESSQGLCPIDCALEQPQGPTCGNAVCEETESTTSCPDDCGPGLLPSEALSGDLAFFVASGSLELHPASSGAVYVLSDSVVRVQLFARNLQKPVTRVQISVGSDTFLMAPNFEEGNGGADLRSAALDDPAYVATFTAGEPAMYQSLVTVFYGDDTSQSVSLAFQAVGPGILFAVGEEEAVSPIGGAAVTLLTAGDDRTWDGSPYAQFNPVTTASDGRFAWYAPNGSYVVRAVAEGYESTERNVAVDDNIVNPSIRMAAVPEPIPVPEEEQPATFLPPQVSAPVKTVQQGLETIRKIPGVQESAQASIPVLAVSAAASGLVLVFAFDLVPFLQYLFTAPILLFARRKRRGFGVVYNAISKLPIGLAVVRLFELPADAQPGERGRLVASRVTDRGGRYFFTTNLGHYRLAVMKSGFMFPSDYLKGKREDGDYLDVYHGEPVEVTDADAIVAANIPLDPSQAASAQASTTIQWKARLRRVQFVVAISGTLLSVAAVVIRPSMLGAVMIAVQVAVFLLVLKLASPRKPKSWGIVYDKATGHPVAKAIVRVFEPRYNKLLETAITDAKGRYSFVLGANEYYAGFEKPGYQKLEVRPIDYTKSKEPTEFGQNVALPRIQDGPRAP